MKIMSLLLIFFSAFSYSQNKSGEPAPVKPSVPLKLTPPTVRVLKPKVDSIKYKMLVKKVDKPELYVMMVKNPKAAMIEIPNLQFLPEKKLELSNKDSAEE